VSRLQAEAQQLKAKAEQASRLQEENAQQRAQVLKLQQANQRSQQEVAQLRLDLVRISEKVQTAM
jgi:hypothetical protein